MERHLGLAHLCAQDAYKTQDLIHGETDAADFIGTFLIG
jgi:hypothetical protein